ncbi:MULTISPECIES: MerR family transcriptional regulator [Paenibacillus]|uniref:MerR family transcriptional regulator n=1 Tax=Paenibacillus TaxID=44249 RepID=UPI001C2FDF6C|nr:MerR family transcriptional regulator [Paenibacillus sp. GbtcB18]
MLSDKLLTVKETARVSGVTVKTLHHYHKIGLLPPREISEAGYRLYGMEELQRLQEILFYRELDVPLEKIRRVLEEKPQRTAVLSEQEELLTARKVRLEQLLLTLRQSIRYASEGERMEMADMFKGFGKEEEWKEALTEQNEYLKETYGYDLLEKETIDVEALNEQAAEAKRFTDGMAAALKDGVKFDHEDVRTLLRDHLDFLNKAGHAFGPQDYVNQAKFFMEDDFHRQMLESQQTGLAYYLRAAAESWASAQ